MFIQFVCPHCNCATQLPLPAVRSGVLAAWICDHCGRAFQLEVLMRYLRERGQLPEIGDSERGPDEDGSSHSQ